MYDAPEAALAEVAYAGTWRIEPIESNESVTFALHYPPSASNISGPIAPAKLGLTPEALVGHQPALRFELRREAGTFVCQGSAEDGRGNGAFRFLSDPRYPEAIAESGMPPLTLHEHIQAGMFDVTSSFVKAIVATGLPHIAFSQLLALKIFRIDPEAVSALNTNFPTASFDNIRSLEMTGVTAHYVEALRRANVGHLSPDNVSALRASGVEQAFIEGLSAKGHLGLSIDEVVSLHGKGA